MPDKVLIIDDEAALAELTMIWVQAAGYEAVIAHGGVAGLAAAQIHRPDIVLLDIMMPDLDGFEVSRRLKQDPNLARVPVIFLSAKVQETARREATAAGAMYFLSKPYEGPDLISAIASALALTKVPVKQGVSVCS